MEGEKKCDSYMEADNYTVELDKSVTTTDISNVEDMFKQHANEVFSEIKKHVSDNKEFRLLSRGFDIHENTYDKFAGGKKLYEIMFSYEYDFVDKATGIKITQALADKEFEISSSFYESRECKE